MNKNLSVNKEVYINASPSKVWNAIVNPEKVKKYFFGTEVISDWEKGSDIIFQGEFQGNSFRDKGVIQEIDPGKYLEYTYWSGFSGLEDEPENYSLVTYELEENNGTTRLKLTQEGFANEEAQSHSSQGWEAVLEGMKKLVESVK